MDANGSQSSTPRRRFLAGLGAAVGVGGVIGAAVNSPAAAAEVSADAPWRPARHAQDDWLDKIPGEHRLAFDTTTPEGLALALRFGSNYFAANKEAYGLKNDDLAVVIVLRHKSTSFGYSDAMWAKYGKQFSAQAEFTDPKTKEPPTANVYTAAREGQAAPVDELIKKGAHFVVCAMSTRGIAVMIAEATGAGTDSVIKELTSNLIGNARMVPAGIVAVSRAQERGYSFVDAS